MQIKISWYSCEKYRIMSGIATKIVNDRTMQDDTTIIFLPRLVELDEAPAVDFFLDFLTLNNM